MVAADFGADTLQWSFPRTTRAAAAAQLERFSARKAGAVAAAAGGVKFKEAQTSMLVADSRSSVQVAAAEGSTKKADMRLGGALFGGGTGAAGGGYGNTNEGKIIAAAFMNNYNKVVGVVRNDPSLQRNVGTLKAEAAAGGGKKPGGTFAEGDVLAPKIANVRVVARAVRYRQGARHAGAHRRISRCR